MTTPVYVLTGFLDAGKTTFLNNLLNRRDWRDVKTLVVQFEAGEEDFSPRYKSCLPISFSKKELDRQPQEIVRQIETAVAEHEPDEIWVEWNGVTEFSKLQELWLQPALRGLCRIEKVLHIADAGSIEHLLGRTGSALPEQIASADFAVLRGVGSPGIFARIRRLLGGINPGIKLYEWEAQDSYFGHLMAKRENPLLLFGLITVLLAAVYFAVSPIVSWLALPVNTVINIFLGILLQAVPFLLIGVLLSSAIQVFVPKKMIERRFPKSTGLGMLVAIISGFCLPVCDCASIPIFRSLVKKGVPLPVAITFMTATPVINPVVILSTYYAFSGNLNIVLARVGLGIVSAVLIGLAFILWPVKGEVLSGGAFDRLMCNCGCYEDLESVTTPVGKLGLFIRHSQAEFFSVGKYLLIGTFISSIFQVLGTDIYTAAQSGAGLAISTIIMMLMSFLLSLCSSSDAVVARSFANQFPTGALMGFLVFGPMMDIKNVMMLSSGFSKRFVGRLLLVSFVVCFATVFALSAVGGI